MYWLLLRRLYNLWGSWMLLIIITIIGFVHHLEVVWGPFLSLRNIEDDGMFK